MLNRMWKRLLAARMTLRDYIAAHAMVALMDDMSRAGTAPSGSVDPTIARRAYEMADAMLLARLA